MAVHVTYGYLLANLLVDYHVHERSRSSYAILPGDELFKCHRSDKPLSSDIRSVQFFRNVVNKTKRILTG
jgi:hypothetical protein